METPQNAHFIAIFMPLSSQNLRASTFWELFKGGLNRVPPPPFPTYADGPSSGVNLNVELKWLALDLFYTLDVALFEVSASETFHKCSWRVLRPPSTALRKVFAKPPGLVGRGPGRALSVLPNSLASRHRRAIYHLACLPALWPSVQLGHPPPLLINKVVVPPSFWPGLPLYSLSLFSTQVTMARRSSLYSDEGLNTIHVWEA